METKHHLLYRSWKMIAGRHNLMIKLYNKSTETVNVDRKNTGD